MKLNCFFSNSSNVSYRSISFAIILCFQGFTTSCFAQKNTTISIFNGTTLNGWTTVNPNHSKFWTVEDSSIVGGDGVTKISSNTYLHTIQEFEDFELRFLFRITGDHNQGLINSGVQYRSIIENNKIIGYQADIGRGYWGDIYDEHRRAKLVDGDMSILKHLLNDKGWNSYIVRCKGDNHELYINGVKVSEYIELDSTIPSKGVIGIQVHSGGNAKVEFKHITISSL